MPGLDPHTAAQLRDLDRAFREELPDALRRGVGRDLFREAQRFKRSYRPHLDQAFQAGGLRVLRGIKVYTAGRHLENLELGIFTRWPAAEVYERGGTITPKTRRWLVVPLSPRVLTPTGRVRRPYRNPQTGGFSAKFWDGVFFVRTRRGLLALRHVTGTASARVGFRSRQRSRHGTRITHRSRPATEIVAVLIRSTRRRPVLDFYGAFDRFDLRLGPAGDDLEAAFARQIPGPPGSR